MRKSYSLLTLVLIIITLLFTFFSSRSRIISDQKTPLDQFSTQRALNHVKNISRKPHYLGSSEHSEVKNYIVNELRKLGLNPTIQEGFSIDKKGVLCKPSNIIATIKGSAPTKALLLMTHYDSAQHSSLGASDAASGVATILEGLRAYIATKANPKNDITICITDAEELGLNGANLFVKEHRKVEDIGLALNFEARGSGGDSYILIETNGKNGKLIDEFSKAGVSYPVGNSFAYSIYKLLPNDTDLTVLREDKNINGFNFAFIDDHFNYHTANDTWQRMDLSTLQHQGNYLMPLLTYFSNADLTNLNDNKDYVYFNAPVLKLVKYPFDWIYTLLIVSIVLFIILLYYGFKTKKLELKNIGIGAVIFVITILFALTITIIGSKLVAYLYPHYNELLHGFTYNGYSYIATIIFSSLAICFISYAKYSKSISLANLLVTPLFIWILISLLTAVYLKGASYFVIIVFFGLLSFFVLIKHSKPNAILLLILNLPSLYIIAPFIVAFPVALGLKIGFVSALLTVLLFGILIPVIGFYRRKKTLGNLSMLIAIVCFITAHSQSDFNRNRKKPNSLVYMLDANQNKAIWATYDTILDNWTENYIKPLENNLITSKKNTFRSKYDTEFTFTNPAPLKKLKQPLIETYRDTIIGKDRHLELCITSLREIDRIDVFTETVFNFKKMTANGVSPKNYKSKSGENINVFTNRKSKRLLTYHVVDNEPLILKIQLDKEVKLDMTVYESSYDLLENNLYSVPERPIHMMPKPFVLNDAIIIKKKVIL